MNHKIFLGGLLCLAVFLCVIEKVRAQGTAFTYQGQLTTGGAPANGNFDFQFSIYDSTNNPGVLLAGPITNSSVAVANGLFLTQLDFGSGIFTGPDRWLQIAVRTNSTATFTNLSPRQQLTPVPYAIFANTASNLSGTLSATQLSGTLPASAFAGYTNTVALTNSGNFFGGTFIGNGGAVTNVNVTHLTGVLADSQLPSNTAFVNSNQTFTGANNLTNWGNNFVGSFFGNGLVGWIVTNLTTIQAEIDHGYVLTNSQTTTVTLPSSLNVGDIVRISGAGSGGWAVAQNAGQSIFGNFLGYSNSSWVASSAASSAWIALACSADGTLVFAAVTNSTFGIEVSTNSGATWSAGGAINAPWRCLASSANGTNLVAGAGNSSANSALYFSSNSGTSWTAATGEPSAKWYSVAMSADGSKAVAVAHGGAIYTSSNGGQNWTSRANSANWQAVASSTDGVNLVAVINSGGIYTSSNSGVSWNSQANAPSANWQAVASSADGSKIIAAIYGGGIYTSSDSGGHWAQTSAITANWESLTCSADGQRIVAVANGGGIYISDSFGWTWSKSTAPTANWSAVCSSSDGDKITAAINNGTIYYSTPPSAQTTSTPGIGGSISGAQGSAVELQYIGNGQFMPVSFAGTIWVN